MILLLPVELMRIVARKLQPHDLKALCETSKACHNVFLPVLYEDVVFASRNDTLDILARRVAAVPTRYLKFTTGIHFNCSMEPELFRTLQERYRPWYCDPHVRKLEHAIKALFSNIQAGTLRRLSWDINLYNPKGLCDPRQNNIETLSITIDKARGIRNPICDGILHLPRIRSLRWAGLNAHTDSSSVFELIRRPGSCLESLTLDMGQSPDHYSIIRREEDDDNIPIYHPWEYYESDELLRRYRESQKTDLLPSLKTLSLYRCSFHRVEIIPTANLWKLRTLKLWNCPGCLYFLEQINKEKHPLQLKSFEMSLDTSCLPSWDFDRVAATISNSVSQFLSGFQGLEDLYLQLSRMDWIILYKGVLNHRDTLRRLVTDDHPGHLLYEKFQHHAIPYSNKLQLSAFGACFSPACFEGELRQLDPRPKWELLNIRGDETVLTNPADTIQDSNKAARAELRMSKKYGSISPNAAGADRFFDSALLPHINRESPRQKTDKLASRSFDELWTLCFLRVAKWAFSEDGLPELQVLAYGLFSEDGDYAEENVLLCRDKSVPTGFRRMDDGDFGMWDLIVENMDMLTSLGGTWVAG